MIVNMNFKREVKWKFDLKLFQTKNKKDTELN